MSAPPPSAPRVPPGTGPRGARLGRPATGAGSVASFPRRLLALAVDWLAAALVTQGTWPGLVYGSPSSSARVLTVFAVEVVVLTWLVQASFGQVVTRLRVERVDGGRLGLVAAALRTLLVCLVIPPLVYDRDGRGLHDRAVGSVVVRR